MRMDDGWSLTPSGRRYALECPYFAGAVVFRLGQLVSFHRARARIREQRGVELPSNLQPGWLRRILDLVRECGEAA